jgi:hypothetical protein
MALLLCYLGSLKLRFLFGRDGVGPSGVVGKAYDLLLCYLGSFKLCFLLGRHGVVQVLFCGTSF